MQGPFGGGRVGRFDPQVSRGAGDRLEQVGCAGSQLEHLPDQRAVTIEQVAHSVRVQVVLLAHAFGLVYQREVAVGPQQWNLFGDRRRHPGGDELGGRVDGVGPHHPVGGVLPARDRHQTRSR